MFNNAGLSRAVCNHMDFVPSYMPTGILGTSTVQASRWLSRNIFSVGYHSLSSLLYRFPHSPNRLTLLFHYLHVIFYTIVLHLSSPYWTLNNPMTPMWILKGIHIPEDSKLTSINERTHDIYPSVSRLPHLELMFLALSLYWWISFLWTAD